MSLLLETIRIEEGKVMNFEYHRERMLRSAFALGFRPSPSFPGNFIPECSVPPTGINRCRVLYNEGIVSCGVTPYVRKNIGTLKVVEARRPDYQLKYADRRAMDELFVLREECDDVLIVCDGMVTDTSYCNVAFERGGSWFTPASPLLKGTMRQCLLDSGTIAEEEILLAEIGEYSAVRLFNAMVPWERAWELPIPF
ncbi:MAG: aminotransferase class IV [Bacteroidales bacterium]|nr:aminotransferase class IV [Bacteroidales bacterium]